MDSKILEILLSLKEDVTEIKAELQTRKSVDESTLKYIDTEVKPWIESHKRVSWLSSRTFTILISFGSILGVFSAVAKVLGK